MSVAGPHFCPTILSVSSLHSGFSLFFTYTTSTLLSIFISLLITATKMVGLGPKTPQTRKGT